jgi:hypothetical protein
MSEEALIDAVRDQLIAQTWTGGSDVVFPTGSVKIVPNLQAALADVFKTGMRTPVALITPSTSESDPDYDEEPDWIRFAFSVLIAVFIPGDHIGERVVMGANQTGGATQSEGQGLVELEVEFFNAVGKLNALESVTLQVRQRAQQGAEQYRNGMFGYRLYELEAFGSAT